MLIREMTKEDLPMLNLDEWLIERYCHYIETQIGPSFIMEVNDEPICAFGALFEWGCEGACEVWFKLISNKNQFAMLRIMKKLLERLAKDYKINRMQALIDCNCKVHEKFIKFLGFYNETPCGMKNKMPNGNSAYLFARYF